MTVNIEIKGNLARLLATEDLMVEHKNVETASFNVESRILTLPQWKTASEFVYDMLVSHEVGHALFTPCRDWNTEDAYTQVPMDYVNVVEDARIERMMKEKFAGLNRDFFNAYKELQDDNFFEVELSELPTYTLIDRINLYFKVGLYLPIPFNDDESEFVTRASKTETFDDVLELSRDIYEYAKQQQETQKQQATADPEGQDDVENTDGESTDSSTDAQTEGSSNNKTEQEEGGEDDDEMTAGKSGGNSIDESRTQRAFDRNSDSMIDRSDSRETTYVSIPDCNLDKVVIPVDAVKTYLDEHWNDVRKDETTYDEAHHEHKRRYYENYCPFMDAEKQYTEYKRSAMKEVNYLVKEFEMKKSANAYARTATAKTGVIDTSKLHTYMYNEDIFKKINVVADGKNHGLIFVLDWSGSMSNILHDSMKQLFNLVWFCKKVNIPFEVYAFSNDAWSIGMDPEDYDKSKYAYRYDDGLKRQDLVKNIKINDLSIEAAFRMVTVLDNTLNNRDLDAQMKNLWLTSQSFRNGAYPHPQRFHLSGTPLNEAIISLKSITKRFIAENKVQKSHIVIFTDGEGYDASYNRRSSYDDSIMASSVPYDSAIRANGRTFHVLSNRCDFTNKLIEAVKSTLPDTSFIGFRVLATGDTRSFTHYYARNLTVEYIKGEIRKKGCVCVKDPKGMDLMFGLPQKNLNLDTDLDDTMPEKDNITKSDISRAFRKTFKNKKSNKIVCQTFISQIA